MCFEEAVEEVEDYSPVWWINIVVHYVREETHFAWLLLQEVFEVGFRDVEFLVISGSR